MGPGEVSVAFDHLLRSRAADQVVVERPAFGAERIGVARLLAEVEPGAPGVVEEQPIAAAAADREEKRNALINGIDRFLGADVRIPEGVGLVSAVESARFVAQSEIVFVARHGLVDGEAAQLEFGGAANGVGGDDVAGEIANHQSQRIALNPDIERCGAEADGRGILRRLHSRQICCAAREGLPMTRPRENCFPG